MATPRKGNKALNLSINEDVKRLFAAQCALEGLEISEVTEQLFFDFLTKQGARVEESVARYIADKKKAMNARRRKRA